MKQTALTALLGLNTKLKNDFDLVNIIRNGLQYQSIARLSKILNIDRKELSEYLHVSERTIARYEKSKKKIPAELGDRIIQILKVYMRALDVFEDKTAALEWLKHENQALKNTAPIKLLDTSTGIDMVFKTLGRMEHGIFS